MKTKDLEYLDRLYYTCSTNVSTGIKRKDAYEIIKNDLERLTKLEWELNALRAKDFRIKAFEKKVGVSMVNFIRNYGALMSLKGRNVVLTLEQFEKELKRKD